MPETAAKMDPDEAQKQNVCQRDDAVETHRATL